MVYSCDEGHSKKYTAMDKSLISLENQIHVTDSCDDFQMLSFGILGIKTDFEKLQQEGALSESEAVELTGRLLQLDKIWSEKLASMDCNQSEEDELYTSGDDDGSAY